MKGHPSPFAILLFFVALCSAAACGGKAGISTQTSPASNDFSWLRITYPDGWHQTSPAYYEGADGYAWLELRDSKGAGPGAVCIGEANRSKPQAYGAYPEIRDLALDGQPACLILPSDDQPAKGTKSAGTSFRRQEALYLLWLPASIRPDTLLALHADLAHILAISESVGFAKALSQPVQTSPAGSGTCDFSISGEAPRITRKAGLRIDEFPIARGANCSPEQQPQEFYQRVESGPPAARAEELRLEQFQSERLGRLNASLAPFGFKVESYDQRLFRVLRHGSVVRSELSWVGQISLSANGKTFFLPVVDSYGGASFLVRPNGIHALDVVDLLVFDLVFPVYAGAERISLAYEYERIPRATGSPALLQILKDDKVVDTFSVSGSTPASGPVRGLWSWQNHWFLQLPGLVLEDGAILNDRLGYPEIFSWRLLKDRPFYFYRKDSLMHAVYDNQTLPGLYDEVLTEPQWGGRILVQMRAYESGLVFFARRGDTWYYVALEAE